MDDRLIKAAGRVRDYCTQPSTGAFLAARLAQPLSVHMPQEMRRTAPEERAAKRQRTEDGFQELSRFDYAAVDRLAQGFQGFILTCGFRRYHRRLRMWVVTIRKHA